MTLVELAAVVAVAGAVVAGAMAWSGALRELLWPVQTNLQVVTRVDTLRHAVATWFRAEHCGANARPLTLPLALAHEPLAPDPAALAAQACAVRVGGVGGEVRRTSCVAGHLAPTLRATFPDLAVDPPRGDEPPLGTFAWEIVTRPLPAEPLPDGWRWPKPQLRVFWHPPAGMRERLADIGATLERELGAQCDDDGNADTAEVCDGKPAGTDGEPHAERFVWSVPVATFDESGARAGRQRRLRDWLGAHALDCDADRHVAAGVYNPGADVMDAFCDGPVDDERIDAGHVIDANGDGCDDVRERPPLDREHPRHDSGPRPEHACPSPAPALLDENQDGMLDFDATGDFVVDQADFETLGC